GLRNVTAVSANNSNFASVAASAANAGSATNLTGPFSGDVTGTQNLTVVTGLQRVAVASTAPADGQVLGYSSVSGQWQPVSASSLAPAGGVCSNPPPQVNSTSPVTPPGYYPAGKITGGNIWFQMAPMPTARGYLGAASLNGKIYALGGRTQSASPLGIAEVYDPNSNVWLSSTTSSGISPMPTPRSSLAAAAVNGKIYAIGGIDGNNLALPTVEVYDPNTNAWTSSSSSNAIAPMPTPRYGLVAVAVNGKLYAIGGRSGSGALDVVEVYDPDSNSWTSSTTFAGLAPLPTAREGAAAAVVNGKIYVIGGAGSSIFNTVEVYDAVLNTWNAVAAMPSENFYFSADAVDGKIYVFGEGTNAALYDPTSNSWSSLPPLPTIRGKGLAAADSNGLLYALGGLFGGPVDANEQYAPAVTVYTFLKK
ncbi:MAG: hypothetical protein JO065_13400, partial [Acidobacteria bacterium]|nr:hypothetical protein [Acidobacteriota bacterium]